MATRNCWQCGHEMVPVKCPPDLDCWECLLCGATYPTDEVNNIEAQDDDPTLALCDAYGHDWKHVNGYTVAFSVCSRCGIVTNH
jgi:hypothetical protein